MTIEQVDKIPILGHHHCGDGAGCLKNLRVSCIPQTKLANR
ncbi:MAG: hypothetical protein RLZZ336_1072 [Cyanobacteriota bacterium]